MCWCKIFDKYDVCLKVTMITKGLNHQAVHCKHSKGWFSSSVSSTGVDSPGKIQNHHFWFCQHIYQYDLTSTHTFNLDINVNILIPPSSFLPSRAIAKVGVTKTCRIPSLLVMHVSRNPVKISLHVCHKNDRDQGAPRGSPHNLRSHSQRQLDCRIWPAKRLP